MLCPVPRQVCVIIAPPEQTFEQHPVFMQSWPVTQVPCPVPEHLTFDWAPFGQTGNGAVGQQPPFVHMYPAGQVPWPVPVQVCVIGLLSGHAAGQHQRLMQRRPMVQLPCPLPLQRWLVTWPFGQTGIGGQHPPF